VIPSSSRYGMYGVPVVSIEVSDWRAGYVESCEFCCYCFYIYTSNNSNRSRNHTDRTSIVLDRSGYVLFAKGSQ
jgi:hypothetical protein